MRIETLWLDGYGCFNSRTLEFAPALQVVFGPNEHGKTTIRSFIGDMLYGQKRSDSQRLYEPGHVLRRPWRKPQCYAGRILYALDDGSQIEVQRNFDRQDESVHVFDHTHARDLTGEFPVLRNREVAFADEHLGLSKTLFLSLATIGHMSLDGLGDDEALAQVRERILALADSSSEEGSAETALKRIETRVAAIGRPAPNSKRPLPTLRARREALEQERAQAVTLRREIADLESKRVAALDELAVLRARRQNLEEERRRLDHHQRAKRLREAERFADRVDELTRQCFGLSTYRDFPLDQEGELQQAANALANSEAQQKRTRAELDELQQQGQAERERLGPAASQVLADIPEETEQRLSEIETRIDRLRERIENLHDEQASAEQRAEKAQEALAELPDFSRHGADPVEWLNQLATSFRIHVRSRDKEEEALLDLRREVEEREAELGEHADVFSRFDDFVGDARDYDVRTRLFEEQWAALTDQTAELQGAAEEYAHKTVDGRLLIFVCAALFVGLTWTAYFFGNPSVYIPAALCALATAWFIGQWTLNRRGLKHAQVQFARTQEELADLEEKDRRFRRSIEKAVKDAGCETVRELEALYDRHAKTREIFEKLHKSLEVQEKRFAEETEQTARLMKRLRDTFAKLGVEVEDEDSVQPAASRAIARYQEYRDAKRRSAEAREVASQIEAELSELQEQLQTLEREEIDLSLHVRETMREAGFREEAKHTSALSALRSYRIRTAQFRQKRGRLEVVQERSEEAKRRLEREQRDLAAHRQAVRRFLDAAKVESAEQWREFAQRAKKYQDLWGERTAAQNQLETLLEGADLDELRKSVLADDEPARVAPSLSLAEITAELEGVTYAIEEKTGAERALELAITERSAAARPLNGIEEDLSQVSARLDQLETELAAATYAAAVIEEVARDKHARIAPALATLASRYLAEVTNGAYEELLINRDLRISIRIPETDHLNSEPERSLSKGTVDQVYLALRLALVQNLSQAGETVPMLLDDPFANYDDRRLASAFRLLTQLSEGSQILLFTCRQDVVRVAEAEGVPVLCLQGNGA